MMENYFYTAIAVAGLLFGLSFSANAQSHFSGTVNTTSTIEREGNVKIGLTASSASSTPRFSVISKLYYPGSSAPSGAAANFNLLDGNGDSFLNLAVCTFQGAPYLFHGKSGTSSIFQVYNNGSTVIGNSTTSGNMLTVYGKVLASQVKVAIPGTAEWSDFVFDKSYKLMPLAEVEKFIDKNKHLPDVPCAEEMVKNGLDLATMDAKLLQKIEELTLYMIEMKKEIEILKEENLLLKSKR